MGQFAVSPVTNETLHAVPYNQINPAYMYLLYNVHACAYNLWHIYANFLAIVFAELH